MRGRKEEAGRRREAIRKGGGRELSEGQSPTEKKHEKEREKMQE